MSLPTLKDRVYADIRSVLSTYVGSPDDHLIVEDDDRPDDPPMVALDGSTSTRSDQYSDTGIHDVRVLDTFSNPYDVLLGRERTFSVDVTISDVGGDRADEVLEDIQNAFEYDPRFREADTFASDVPIDNVRVRDTSPTDRSQRVGHALSIEIDYLRTFRYSDLTDPPTEVTKVVQEYEYGNVITTT